MVAILALFPSALQAASRGISESQWERETRAQGMGARSSEMGKLFAIAVSVVTAQPSDPFKPQHLAPTASELQAWPTKKATGIRQNVTLTYRNRATGAIKQTWWSTIGDVAITREQATAMAVAAYADTAEAYEQDLIGAVHTSAYRMTPDLFS
jgi:hypothetical protein